MIPLSAISGMPPDAAELLAAAGIRSATLLARQEPVSLHSRLEVLAWQRGRSSSTPSREQLEQWIAIANMLTPPAEAEVLSMDDIPEAVPVAPPPAEQAGGAWIPPSARAVASVSRADAPYESPRPAPAPVPDNTWRKVDPSRFTTIEDYNEGRTSVQPLSRAPLKDQQKAVPAEEDEEDEDEPTPRRMQRIRSTGETLSRWVRRGVVHPRPFHTWLGALVSITWRLALLVGVVAFVWLIVASRQPTAHKDKVIGAAVILLILGCMQLHFAGRSRCRICSCNLYYSKNCHKNRKAHLIPGLGYVASAALHLLTFGWFRCMYCGTAIRLRPGQGRRGDD